MTTRQVYEQDMQEWYGLQMLYVHEAYREIVIYALRDIGISFSYLPSFDDEKPCIFWIMVSPASTWPNESFDMQKQIDQIWEVLLDQLYVHRTPDGEYVVIKSPVEEFN